MPSPTASPAPARWRWGRVPSVLWLMLVGTTLSLLVSIGRLVYFVVRGTRLRPEDDFNLTVVLVLLCGFGMAFFGLAVYMLAQPATNDE